MGGFRLRTVASRATALTHALPRWAPLALFMIACAVFTLGLVLLQSAVGPAPEWIELHHFGPAMAVGLLFLVFRDHHRAPELALLGRPSLRLLAAVLGSVAIGAVIVITTMAARDTITLTRTPLPVAALPVVIAIATAVVTALGQETAWRAYLQPELEQWWGPLPAAIGVGVFWAVWATISGALSAEAAAAFALMTISLSVLIRGVLEFVPGANLVIGTALHATLNASMLVFLPERGQDRLSMWGLAITSLVVAAVVWLVARWRYSAGAAPERALMTLETDLPPDEVDDLEDLDDEDLDDDLDDEDLDDEDLDEGFDEFEEAEYEVEPAGGPTVASIPEALQRPEEPVRHSA
ncbi:CPBP family glutamic-type intramembrane protease [Propionibacteriaceae bacterium Y2011]